MNYIICKHCNTKNQYRDQDVKCNGYYSVRNVDGQFDGLGCDYFIRCSKCNEKIIIDHGFTEFNLKGW